MTPERGLRYKPLQEREMGDVFLGVPPRCARGRAGFGVR